MKISNRTKTSILLIGDIIALYLALILTLYFRYGSDFYAQFIGSHFFPFSVIFPLWIIVFYVAGLYDLRRLRNNLEFLKTLSLTLSVNALLTIAIFYLVPLFEIAPRRNLFVFIVILALIEAFWRRTFNIRASFREGLNKVLLIGDSPSVEEVAKAIKDNPQIGYEIKIWIKKGLADPEIKNLRSLVKANDINLIVVPKDIKDDFKLSQIFYELLVSDVETIDILGFYEAVLRKIPLSEIKESWFLENRVAKRKFYDDLKRGLEFLLALIIQIIVLPLEILIAIIIKITSPKGSIIFKQARIGFKNNEFTVYKFRSMKADAEINGPQWSKEKDERVILFGKFLRYTHLDELPQLINILRGEISFVGPRPERPEFVKILKDQVPHYEIRHLVKPGITGWAQINYPYGSSAEDAYKKLTYDIYYLKNRSLILDLAIALKTIKTLFITPK